MARLRLAKVTRRFSGAAAVDGVDLEVEDGGFLAVLGPSGCGKTTLLRLVAGFEIPDDGTVAIGEEIVSGPDAFVPPEKRRVGVVFQSYALWPHMNVARNVGYALEVRGERGADYRGKVDAAMAAVGLTGLGERRPAQLSGGQRQRVALARCLVMEPRIVLLDEPLANLDVHLRAAMQDAFAQFHKTTRATMLYVTHDQAEALALADRVAVMDKGMLVQLAAPAMLYAEPATAMVAGFVGRGAVVDARIEDTAGPGRVAASLLGVTANLRAMAGQGAGPAKVLLRPEGLKRAAGNDGFAARVRRVIYQGAATAVELESEGSPGTMLLWSCAPADAPAPEAILRFTVADGWVIPDRR